VPLVPLVGGRRGVLAASVLAAALLLTQLWFPSRYWDLALRAAPLESWLVLARNVGLVLLFVVLLAPVRRQAPVPAS
jgi:hypothetical protein